MAIPLEIVVVDDEEQITELIKTFILITSKDAHVHTFTSSVEAYNYLQTNHNVDILITDYKMPVYDGIQLMESTPEKVKKILISGYISEIAEEKLQKMDALFFEKPVPIRTLRKIILDEEVRLR
jgi:DNA-binding NtrC family response regulator